MCCCCLLLLTQQVCVISLTLQQAQTTQTCFLLLSQSLHWPYKQDFIPLQVTLWVSWSSPPLTPIHFIVAAVQGEHHNSLIIIKYNQYQNKYALVALKKLCVIVCIHTFFSHHSALLGFLLVLATVKLKSGFSFENFGVWIFISKVIVFNGFKSFFLISKNYWACPPSSRLLQCPSLHFFSTWTLMFQLLFGKDLTWKELKNISSCQLSKTSVFFFFPSTVTRLFTDKP